MFSQSLLTRDAQPTRDLALGVSCRVCDVCYKVCTTPDDLPKPAVALAQDPPPGGPVPDSTESAAIPPQSQPFAIQQLEQVPPNQQASLLSSSVVPSDWTWSTF
ncbi:hypothetical protein HDV03_000278 [Kappamyces sp. JEL0829]|nr:hypothetical protein HDV03_000278 [Kappamyces sp. JEL0829]